MSPAPRRSRSHRVRAEQPRVRGLRPGDGARQMRARRERPAVICDWSRWIESRARGSGGDSAPGRGIAPLGACRSASGRLAKVFINYLSSQKPFCGRNFASPTYLQSRWPRRGGRVFRRGTGSRWFGNRRRHVATSVQARTDLRRPCCGWPWQAGVGLAKANTCLEFVVCRGAGSGLLRGWDADRWPLGLG